MIEQKKKRERERENNGEITFLLCVQRLAPRHNPDGQNTEQKAKSVENFGKCIIIKNKSAKMTPCNHYEYL